MAGRRAGDGLPKESDYADGSARTGSEAYQERLHQTRQRTLPVVGDDKIYCAVRDGVVHVLKAGRKLYVLARNDLGEAIASTLAISGGRMYVRTFKSLLAIGATRTK